MLPDQLSRQTLPTHSVALDELAARTLAGLAEYYRLLAVTESRSRFVERDGVVAAIVPATPNDGMFNTVVYHESLGVSDLDRLDKLYAQNAINAWGIWVADKDHSLQDVLDARGFVPITKWTGMGLVLTDAAPPELPATCEVTGASVSDFTRVNDSAHGGHDYSLAFAQWPGDGLAKLWALRCSGRVVSTLLELNCHRDCSIHSVATVRSEWGKGMASALMQYVMATAYRGGCTTSTLQAAPAAESIYRRLGYTPNGASWTVLATRLLTMQSDARQT
jgi:GNAT superfamily N-acetyltransferase